MPIPMPTSKPQTPEMIIGVLQNTAMGAAFIGLAIKKQFVL